MLDTMVQARHRQQRSRSITRIPNTVHLLRGQDIIRSDRNGDSGAAARSSSGLGRRFHIQGVLHVPDLVHMGLSKATYVSLKSRYIAIEWYEEHPHDIPGSLDV